MIDNENAVNSKGNIIISIGVNLDTLSAIIFILNENAINIIDIPNDVKNWEKLIGLTKPNAHDDNIIAIEIAVNRIGIKNAAIIAFAGLISPKAVSNLPIPNEITANIPAIKIAVIAWPNPIGLTIPKT